MANKKHAGSLPLSGGAAAGTGGVSLAAFASAPVTEQVAVTTRSIKAQSSPTDLRITDLRYTTLQGVPSRSTIIRIDTNQGISGYGEMRDLADPRYALFLKSRLLGQNPCNVELLFKRITQFGSHGRRGGGVSAAEIALWDLAGKAYEIPVYQLLGGAFRKQIRAYATVTPDPDPEEYADRLADRVAQGYTFLNMDLGIDLIADGEGAFNGRNLWPGDLDPSDAAPGSYGDTEGPFTRIQLTNAGLDALAAYVEEARSRIGYGVPIGHDHLGHYGIEDKVKLANRLAGFAPAYLEDVTPWMYTDQYAYFHDQTDVPVMTGQDIYRLSGFKPLIDSYAVDLIHPSPTTVGGLLETKKIGDYAEDKGIAMLLHHAGTPVGAIAACHVAAATQNFVALEHHGADPLRHHGSATTPWDNLIEGPAKPLVSNGFFTVPEGPGLGIQLTADIRRFLAPGSGFFAATPEWNSSDSWDRIWT